MIHEKWVVADTHFFHTNTWQKFKREDGTPLRPFSSNLEMHEYIVKKWNSVVEPNDYVYHLGDVTFFYGMEFATLMRRLNGKKRLILGNHDDVKGTNLIRFFERVELWKGFKDKDDPKDGFTLSHLPIPLEHLRDGSFNVHGHLHQNIKKDPHYINVCVETRDYTPVHFDTIFEEIRDVKYKIANSGYSTAN